MWFSYGNVAMFKDVTAGCWKRFKSTVGIQIRDQSSILMVKISPIMECSINRMASELQTKMSIIGMVNYPKTGFVSYSDIDLNTLQKCLLFKQQE